MHLSGAPDRTAVCRLLGMWLALLVLAAPGCAKKVNTASGVDQAADASKASASDDGSGSASAASATKSSSGTAGSAVTLKLLSAGDEPRQPLRYHFKAGRSETAVMDLEMAMNMEAGGRKMMSITVPIVRLSMAFDAKEVTADGNLRYEFRVTESQLVDADLSEPRYVQLAKELEAMVGLSGWALVNTRGETIGFELNELPPGSQQNLQQMLDNMRKSMRNISAPLPAEPVGRGSKWEVTMPIESREFSGTQTAVYTLWDVQGSTGKLGIDLRQIIPPESFKMSGMENGAQVSLKGLTSWGRGTTWFDLDRLVPKAAMKMNMVMQMNATDPGSGQSTDIDMKIDFGMKIGPQGQTVPDVEEP